MRVSIESHSHAVNFETALKWISGGKPPFLTCYILRASFFMRGQHLTSQEEGLAPAQTTAHKHSVSPFSRNCRVSTLKGELR